jgi:GxxExxY protein
MKRELIHEELSGKIIGAAMTVLNELQPGLDEKLYERALILELQRRGHAVDVQRRFPVFYHSEMIGDLVPDLIIDGRLSYDQRAGIGALVEFQKCATGLETSGPPT